MSEFGPVFLIISFVALTILGYLSYEVIFSKDFEEKVDSEIRKRFNKKGLTVIGIANPTVREVKNHSPFFYYDLSEISPFEKQIFRKVFYLEGGNKEKKMAWVKVDNNIFTKYWEIKFGYKDR